MQPTGEMVEAHNVSHIPFRNWCPACVRGRGKSVAHRTVSGKDTDQVPVISVDYGFFGAPGEGPGQPEVRDADLPVLVAFDRKTKAVWGHPVPAKGLAHPWATTSLLADIEKTGYRRIAVKCDQERRSSRSCRR